MIRDQVRMLEKVLLSVIWTAAFGFIMLLTIAGWPSYWKFIAAETTPLGWFESVLLILIAFTAAMNAMLSRLAACQSKTVWGWIALAAGFSWLALDERFALHERLRDNLLKPTGFRLLPWMETGDILVPVYMVCGLAATWFIWRMLRSRPAALTFFVAALGLSAVAVSMDTIDIRKLSQGTERFLQSVEEGFETFGMVSFLSSFLCIWSERLQRLMAIDRGVV